MEYHVDLPLSTEDVDKFHIGDILYVSGMIFTARDEAHHMMLDSNSKDLPFTPGDMGLYHCGPLMKQTATGWEVVSAGPTTSSRMEIFEDDFLQKYGIRLIIGKGGMGPRTQKALQHYHAVYTAYTGGAGALAADKVKNVPGVYWLDELGMPEAVWLFEVNEFGPLVVAMDSHGKSLYGEI